MSRYDKTAMALIAEPAAADLYVGPGADVYRGLEVCAALRQAGLVPRVCLSDAAGQAIGPAAWHAAGASHVSAGPLPAPADGLARRITIAACAGPVRRGGWWPDGLVPDVLAETAPAGSFPAWTIADGPDLARCPAVTITASLDRPDAPASYPGAILDAALYVLSRGAGPLAGQRVVVTAGGTREPLDPVRFITNRASGRMGHAIADAARDLGADVTLISSAPHLPAAVGVQRAGYDTVESLRRAVLHAARAADCVVMAAAVSDYRPAAPARDKLKKTADGLDLHLDTVPNFVGEIPAGVLRVGFAAETCADLDYTARKRVSRGFDLICLNDVSRSDAGFEVGTNQITVLGEDGVLLATDLLTKAEVARLLMELVAPVLAGRTPEREGAAP